MTTLLATLVYMAGIASAYIASTLYWLYKMPKLMIATAEYFGARLFGGAVRLFYNITTSIFAAVMFPFRLVGIGYYAVVAKYSDLQNAARHRAAMANGGITLGPVTPVARPMPAPAAAPAAPQPEPTASAPVPSAADEPQS